MNSPSALGVQSFRDGPLMAKEEECRHRWVLFPYDLAVFVSQWQGFEGGDVFLSRGDAMSRREKWSRSLA
jgi:hypothetical protein